ncbi:18S pre-ribosomal assembly protein gar2-like protein [Perilla frutescens var. hirtella]|uniref:18S pre-ribosomal assembly protein gar2-like protein n=1 Tax=Perilla frutescens var. hirtella TaxID=608512 RepID=A0AAD4P167_PERFH|nr:18S pre-ribosomal assembly protein gar2-like protein [Perilla frutescens var. hirtella]
MKENQNETSLDSRSFGKETGSLMFGSKDRCELNDSRMDANLTELETKDRDDCLNCKVTDDSSVDNEEGTVDSPKKAGQNGPSHHLSMENENGTVDSPRKESKDELSHHLSIWDKDADSLSSDSSDIDKEQRSSEHESLDTVEEFADCNGSDSRDSSSPLFTDKNVMECDLPELEVCYKEMDCQILKDICVDEGRPQKDVNVIESCKDEEPGCLFPQPPNDIDHCEAEEDSSLDADSFTADQCGSSKELNSQERLDSCPEDSLEKDTVKQCETENAVETVEAYFDATGKAENDSSEDDSLVDRKLPIEDIDTQSSLGLDAGNKVVQVPDQILNQEAEPKSPASSSAEAGGGTGEDVQASCLLYNSKVENGSITFNFSSPEGAVPGNCMTEDVEEQSADSEDVHKDVNAENLPEAMEEKVQCTSDRVGDSNKQCLINDEGNSDGGPVTSYVQSVRIEDSSCGNDHEGSPEHKQEKSDDVSIDAPVQSPTNESPAPTNDVLASEPNAPNHEGMDSGDVPVVSQLQQDLGETSFSAASMITYSGPIAFSGSLSHRSDGSTTSGKSFAFPVLQSEWNSSPVRMAKADRRHFRKHKGWRSVDHPKFSQPSLPRKLNLKHETVKTSAEEDFMPLDEFRQASSGSCT